MPILRKSRVGLPAPSHNRRDIIHELLSLPFLDADTYRHRIGYLTREAADEIIRLRNATTHGAAIDFPRQLVTDREGRQHRPGPNSWRVLMVLVSRAGQNVSHQTIIQAVYGNRADGGPDNPSESIKVVVCKLRRWLPWLIINIHGVGYRLEGYGKAGQR